MLEKKERGWFLINDYFVSSLRSVFFQKLVKLDQQTMLIARTRSSKVCTYTLLYIPDSETRLLDVTLHRRDFCYYVIFKYRRGPTVRLEVDIVRR